jgi:glucitol operon activator protein
MILIGILWLVQVVLTYFQVTHYNKRILELKNKGIVAIGRSKGVINAGAIVILATDEDGRIVDAEIMKGISVFARFRKMRKLIGKHIEEVSENLGSFRGQERKAVEKAVEDLILKNGFFSKTVG